ncbi:MAG: host attachment protein [Burkholderiaceae bacterium]|jgi:protein required for attachment to host cells|nr:host attachment protein [Burkholderiaceae bacterium]
MPTRTTWVVVADEGLARIFEIPGRDEDLVEVETLTFASARADAADLRRDAYGRRAGSGTLSGSYPTASAGESELHREAESFARRLADWLIENKRANRYEALKIAAAPRFLGLLRRALDPQVTEAVVEELDKDLVNLDRRELTLRLGSLRPPLPPG